MLIVYIGLASIVLSLVMLLAIGKYASQRKSSAEPTVDVAASLRELLMARAEGRMDQEEFDRRQAALHAVVLQSPAETPWLTPQRLRIGLSLVAVVLAIWRSPATPWAVVLTGALGALTAAHYARRSL